jgi:arginyl-tRNA synthetase
VYLRQRVRAWLQQAVKEMQAEGNWPADLAMLAEVERPASAEHGDYSTNLALKLAKPLRQSPRAIAEKLKVAMEARGQELIESVEIAGPGFVNLRLNPAALAAEVGAVRASDKNYGSDTWGQGRKLLLEFVSANPTGPLNIVSARAAAVGDALARILSSQGVLVSKEYYINDAGNQARLFGVSAYCRWQEMKGFSLVFANEKGEYETGTVGPKMLQFPAEGYRGEYVKDVAAATGEKYGSLIEKTADPGKVTELFRKDGIAQMVASHRRDLETFAVTFDTWFSELTLYDSGKVKAALADLQARGYIFEKEGATWFRSTDFGDDKDRVLIKANGENAYIMADIAYHRDKFDRGYTELIDIWGPDHHGYIPRMKAAMQALGHSADTFRVLIAQQVNLLENGEPVVMSKRAGVFITMADLIKDVGRDVARFFFLMRSTDAHLDFDLDLARKHTDENPVFYVQYAHARICSILTKAREEKWQVPSPGEGGELSQSLVPEEMAVVRALTAFPEIVEAAAANLEPHTVAFYLRDLATEFHRFYTLCRVLDPEAPERSAARLALIDAIRIVLRNGLDLLGISAPEKM